MPTSLSQQQKRKIPPLHLPTQLPAVQKLYQDLSKKVAQKSGRKTSVVTFTPSRRRDEVAEIKSLGGICRTLWIMLHETSD